MMDEDTVEDTVDMSSGSIHHQNKVEEILLKNVNMSGSDEDESRYEGEEMFILGYTSCKKNPGHSNFMAIGELQKMMKFNSLESCGPDLENCVKVLSDMTVRLVARHVSEARPQNRPCSNIRYPFSSSKGKERLRSGTGWVYKVCLKPKDRMSTSQDNVSIPQAAHVIIKTATHVIYDKTEAKDAQCDFYFDCDDLQDCPKLVKLTGAVYVESDEIEDISTVTYICDDINLAEEIDNKTNEFRHFLKSFFTSNCSMFTKVGEHFHYEPNENLKTSLAQNINIFTISLKQTASLITTIFLKQEVIVGKNEDILETIEHNLISSLDSGISEFNLEVEWSLIEEVQGLISTDNKKLEEIVCSSITSTANMFENADKSFLYDKCPLSAQSEKKISNKSNRLSFCTLENELEAKLIEMKQIKKQLEDMLTEAKKQELKELKKSVSKFNENILNIIQISDNPLLVLSDEVTKIIFSNFQTMNTELEKDLCRLLEILDQKTQAVIDVFICDIQEITKSQFQEINFLNNTLTKLTNCDDLHALRNRLIHERIKMPDFLNDSKFLIRKCSADSGNRLSVVHERVSGVLANLLGVKSERKNVSFWRESIDPELKTILTESIPAIAKAFKENLINRSLQIMTSTLNLRDNQLKVLEQNRRLWLHALLICRDSYLQKAVEEIDKMLKTKPMDDRAKQVDDKSSLPLSEIQSGDTTPVGINCYNKCSEKLTRMNNSENTTSSFKTEVIHVKNPSDISDLSSSIKMNYSDTFRNKEDVSEMVNVDSAEERHSTATEADNAYKPSRVIIASHPHGCSKKISIGDCRSQNLTPSPVLTDFYQSPLTYTTPTCPGSSGAYVLVLGGSEFRFLHLVHSASLENVNFSSNGKIANYTD